MLVDTCLKRKYAPGFVPSLAFSFDGETGWYESLFHLDYHHSLALSINPDINEDIFKRTAQKPVNKGRLRCGDLKVDVLVYGW